MDPVSLIVTALASGAAAGLGNATSTAVKDAYQALRALLQRAFARETAASTVLEEHAKAPDVWAQPLEQQIHRLQVERDPEVIQAAQQLMALVDAAGTRAGTYDVNVQGHGIVGFQTSGLQASGVTAGRDVKLTVDKRKKRTHIALGGGFVLALVLLLIWVQYSAGERETKALTSYRAGVVATCIRIQQSTPAAQPHVDPESGIHWLRKDILQAVKHADKVRDEQLANLLQQQPPSSLSEEFEAVRQAENATDAAQPAYLKEIRSWPRKIPMDELQDLSHAPAASAAQDSSRRLADALTRLAGESCPLVAA